MDLKDFLGSTVKPAQGKPRALAPVSATPSTASVAEVETDSDEGPTSAAEESVVVRDETPSGRVIEFQAKPRRLYRVNGVEVPSVTTVLDLIHKPSLVWWGQGRGVQGVLDLFDRGALTSAFDWSTDKERLAIADDEDVDEVGYATEESVVNLLKKHRLTVNHRLDAAADRGVNVHDALEQWARYGRMPFASGFPEAEQGYVQGLLKFLEDVDPIPAKCEVMVGSLEHAFAGRFDLVIEVSDEREYTSRCYPKRADKRETLLPGRYLCDLKTSKQVYTSHQLQLAAYELAAVECGYDPTDAQAVIHVTADGKYELVFSQATADQFLAIRKAYTALKELS